MKSSNQIKKFILDNINHHKKDIIQTAIQRFGISRQAVLKHMHFLIDQKQVVAHGKTRDRFYELRPYVNFSKTIDIDSEFSIESILKNQIFPHFSSLSINVHEICEFSISAVLQNIVDHANATKLYYKIFMNHKDIHIIVSDNGCGLFEHMRSLLNLENNKVAAIELAKGRVTTDPDHHSGDELNTVIQLFDKVTIDASGKSLTFIDKTKDWTIKHSTQKHGTRIHLEIESNSEKNCKEIFQNIFNGKQNSVRIPINLLKIEKSELVNSRAQAQSILRNISDCKNIEFDFNNIDLIGPAFADELVRKTKAKNQVADIKWTNSNKTVDLLMSMALNRLS